jgi:hypothetical protein
MTQTQNDLLEKLEILLARMLLDGRSKTTTRLGEVIEAIHRHDTVWAVILADAYGFPERFVEKIRQTFRIKRID